MELSYLLIAAVIIILPIVLTKLFSGKSRETSKVLGASAHKPKPAAMIATEVDDLKVQSLIAQGKQLEAIKMVAESGVPLVAAKARVYAMARALGQAPETTPDPVDLDQDSRELSQEVRQLVSQGRKIDAIKLMRETKSLSLEAAKDAVEAIEKHGRPTLGEMGMMSTVRLAQQLGKEVHELVASGQKVEAIKLVREQTGLGLKEAKDIVDRLG